MGCVFVVDVTSGVEKIVVDVTRGEGGLITYSIVETAWVTGELWVPSPSLPLPLSLPFPFPFPFPFPSPSPLPLPPFSPPPRVVLPLGIVVEQPSLSP